MPCLLRRRATAPRQVSRGFISPAIPTMLFNMYHNGTGVAIDYYTAAERAEKIQNHHIEKDGEESGPALKWLNNLASVIYDLGNYQEAARCGTPGADHINTLSSLHNTAACFEKAYHARLSTLGPDHRDTAAIKAKLDTI